MEYLLDRADLEKFRCDLEEVPWLGFDHDTTEHRPVVPIRAYPLLRGWSVAQLEALEVDPVSDIKTLSMLQSWLFFGVLEHATGLKMKTEKYTSVRHGQVFLKTDDLRNILLNLHFLIATNHDVSSNYDPDQVAALRHPLLESLRRRIDATVEAVEVARHFNEQFTLQGCAESVNQVLFDTVVHHLALLLETLTNIVYRVKHTTKAVLKVDRVRLTKSKKLSLKARLSQKQWCPSSYDFLYNQSGLWSVCYAALVGPSAATISVNHDDCASSKCTANNIDEQSYRTRHISQQCGCASTGPNFLSLRDCLESGSIPLIDPKSILFSSGRKAHVMKFADKQHTPFVAISHVWSDGLGGCSEDGLPACQLEFLQMLLGQCEDSNLCNARHIWLDTLCIPKDRSLRQMAVRSIRSVFEQATAVIVLDSTLQSHSISDCTSDLLFLRYVTASWNRRLWTLQESHASSNILFLFADGLKSWDYLRDQSTLDTFPSPLAMHCALDMWAMKADLEVRSIGLLARQLRWRTTSKLEDEVIATASLLKLSTDKLSTLHGEERLCEFWKLVGKIPKGIVLINSLDRMSSRNFSWAPRSLMSTDANMEGLSLHGKSERVTDHGLYGTWSMLRFSRSEEFDTENLRMYLLYDISAQQVYWLIALEPFSKFTCNAIAFEDIAYRDGATESEIFGMLCLRKENRAADLAASQYSIQARAGGQQWAAGSDTGGAIPLYARTYPGARAIFVQSVEEDIYIV